MARNWGGQLRENPDGSYHATLWRSSENGGKGERLSWEQEQDGRVRNAHHTDQDTRTHSSDPSTWRAAAILLPLLLLVCGFMWMLC
jgi:hypothetical protein